MVYKILLFMAFWYIDLLCSSVCVEGRDGLMEVVIKASAASTEVATTFIQLGGVWSVPGIDIN